jgi:hypothetical protein
MHSHYARRCRGCRSQVAAGFCIQLSSATGKHSSRVETHAAIDPSACLRCVLLQGRDAAAQEATAPAVRLLRHDTQLGGDCLFLPSVCGPQHNARAHPAAYAAGSDRKARPIGSRRAAPRPWCGSQASWLPKGLGAGHEVAVFTGGFPTPAVVAARGRTGRALFRTTAGWVQSEAKNGGRRFSAQERD